MMRWLWRHHAASVVLVAIALVFGLVTAVSGYYYWQAEGPKAHGSFWNWLLHHSIIEMFGEVLIGGLLLVHLTKLREVGSPETGDDPN